MARTKLSDAVLASKNGHEYVMEPLAGKGFNLEVALAYIGQVLKQDPAYRFALGRAISEIEDARQAIQEAQHRAVERWRKEFH